MVFTKFFIKINCIFIMLIVSIYPNFANKGGAQDVALQLAERLNPYTKPIVLTKTPIDRIVSDYRSHINFLSFSWKNISMLSKKKCSISFS